MLSVIIITKNEEDTIADCIKAVKEIADEIIVVDALSIDKTSEIAKDLGAKVFVRNFTNFSDQRNFGFKRSRGDWVLYLDADEQATEEFKTELKKTIANYKKESGIGGYFIKRRNFYLGKDWNYTDKVQRLFRREFFGGWHGKVHESARITGEFGVIESPVLHYTHRDFYRMVEKTNEWSEFEAEERLLAHHPQMNILRFIRVMLTGFFKSYFCENGWRNGTAGVVEAVYQAFSMFITYAKLWEAQRGRELGNVGEP